MDEDNLKLIEQARSRNNKNWMGILRLALEHAPHETKLLLKSIRTIDLDISYYTQRIADENSQPRDRDGASAIHRGRTVSKP